MQQRHSEDAENLILTAKRSISSASAHVCFRAFERKLLATYFTTKSH